MTKELDLQFIDYIKTFKHNTSIQADSKIFSDPLDKTGIFSYCESPYFYDFNRELIEDNEEIFAIRCDDDFFVCAVLPFKYTELSLVFIIDNLWPGEDYEIKPDSITPRKKMMKPEERRLAEFSVMQYYFLDFYEVQSLTDHALKMMIEIMLENKNGK